MVKGATQEESSKVSSSTQRYGESIYLPQNPLKTTDLNYLEKILEVCEGFNFLNVYQHAIGGPAMAMPSITDEDPINKALEGGITIRKRYSIENIVSRYKILSNL